VAFLGESHFKLSFSVTSIILDIGDYHHKSIAEKSMTNQEEESLFVAFKIPDNEQPFEEGPSSIGGDFAVYFNTGHVLEPVERDLIQRLVCEVLPPLPHSTLKSLRYFKGLYKDVISAGSRKILADQRRLTLLRRIIYACVVRQVIINEQKPLPPVDFLQSMPFYEDPAMLPNNEAEVLSLRHFIRAIVTINEIGLTGKNNKQTYIDVAAMLDGSNRTYAFGGAPSKGTIRRSVIFHVITRVALRDPIVPKKRSRPSSEDEIHFDWLSENEEDSSSGFSSSIHSSKKVIFCCF
jgi:hypothetical protein